MNELPWINEQTAVKTAEERLHLNSIMYPRDTVAIMVEPKLLRVLLEMAKRAPTEPFTNTNVASP